MQATNNNSKWGILLLVQTFIIIGTVYLTIKVKFAPLQLITIAALFLLIQAVAFGRLNLNTFKDNFIKLLLAIVFTIVAIGSGGVFETINRFFVGCLAIFLLCLLAYSNKKRFIENLINLMFVLSPMIIIYTQSLIDGSHFFYPIFLIPFIVLVIFLCIASMIKNNFFRFGVGVLAFWLLAYVGFRNYINKVSGEKFSADKAVVKLFPLISSNGDTIRLEKDMAGKIVVLDFWHSSCGACFNEFPKLQALNDKYASDNSIHFATVNVKLPKDTVNQFKAMISEYRFNKYRTQLGINDNEWEIEAYPTTLVIDKKGRIRYKGLVNYKSGINNIDNIFSDLKKE